MKDVRRKRGMTGATLAARMTEVGIGWDRSIVANLENGRRGSASVDEFLALAYVLNVHPVDLLVPDDEEPYQVTPTLAQPTRNVRAWFRGTLTLHGGDMRLVVTEKPRHELREFMRQAAEALDEDGDDGAR